MACFAGAAVSLLLQNYVDRTAEQRPDSTAVVSGSERWSYRDVAAFSNRLARTLQAAGCSRGDRVALVLPKCPRTIAAIIGILKAGSAYVPIDPTSPPTRASAILQSAEPKVILTDTSGSHCLTGDAPAAVLDISNIPSFCGAPVHTSHGPEDMAYIMYTSGSTGIPKGVVITHANVTAFVEWAVRYFDLSAADRMSGHPPLYFDLSVFDIFGAFAAGAELHLPPGEINVSARSAASFIRSSRLSQWFSVPSLMTYLAKFDTIAFGDFPDLRRVLWCGEALPAPVLRHWMERLPHVRFTNLYGPTEATIASSYFTVEKIPSPTDEIPIGTACPGETLLVLDEELRPVRAGEIGDLFIAGSGLSSGYWRDVSKTEAAFLQYTDQSGSTQRIYKTGDLAKLDTSGFAYFVGRKDSQIKSRGYRIELGEIESALNTISELKESAVVAVCSEGFENTLICCAYSLGATGLTPVEIRSHLRSRLPAYMVPSRWMQLETLPRNANGKIDRALLKEKFRIGVQPHDQFNHLPQAAQHI
jgi:amino acid adenylation domain-containing protein